MRRLLIVDDQKETLDYLSHFATEEGLTVQAASDLENTVHRLKAWKPHLVLLNKDIAAAPWLELLARIKSVSAEDHASVALFAPEISGVELKQAFEAGADDFRSIPFRAEELASCIRSMLRLKEAQDSLRRANHRIEEMSSTDELTGALNIRTLYRKGEEEIQRSRRFRKPVSSLLVNLDHFSDLNQKAGFEVGNRVLQEVAKKIVGQLRSIDRVARMGSDEFFVLLPETDLAGAETVAEKIRQVIQSAEFTQAPRERTGSSPVSLTVCIGVAGLSEEQPEQTMGDLMHSAFEALRSAKATGPGSIEIYSFA